MHKELVAAEEDKALSKFTAGHRFKCAKIKTLISNDSHIIIEVCSKWVPHTFTKKNKQERVKVFKAIVEIF
ncbi:33905_t:CDS:2 [Gigaspora margarita]|uniref:33905_t:CDS:1 n=1 Tax=Gigaspora margarita TaxID=4874 RepID=A0ABN7UNJ0_GIGMA|nr:33905_t:CDS:2 [Gigaspora margarita]